MYHGSNTTKFKAKDVSPLLETKFVGMTLPDKPPSPKITFSRDLKSVFSMIYSVFIRWKLRFLTDLT